MAASNSTHLIAVPHNSAHDPAAPAPGAEAPGAEAPGAEAAATESVPEGPPFDPHCRFAGSTGLPAVTIVIGAAGHRLPELRHQSHVVLKHGAKGLDN